MKNFIQNKCKNFIAIVAFLLISGSSFGQCIAGFTHSTNQQTVTFTNTSTGTNVNTYYYWNFGDNQYGNNQNEVHTYQYGGLYVACLTIIDSLNNCYSYACDSFTIVGPPAPCQASFWSSSSNNLGSFQSTSTGTTPNTVYNWSFGDNSWGTGQSVNHTYLNSGWYNVCLAITDNSTQCADSFCQYVYINGVNNSQCNASFISSSTNNVGSFTSTSTGTTTNTVYSWNFGDSQSGSGQNSSHTYLNAGWYYVCLTIYDINTLCADSSCQYIYINGTNNSPCAASFVASSSNNLGSFSSTSSGTTTNTTYFWSFGDNQYGNGQTANHTYLNAGWYNVCLTITDNTTQCYDSTCQYIYINGTNNSTCSANFTNSTSGQTVNFTDASTGTNVNTNYFWDFGDGNYSSVQNPTNTYSFGGTYNVCLTIWDSLNSCLSYYCDTVTVSGPNQPCNAAFWAFPDTFNLHNTFVYDMSTGTNPMQYTWSWGDNTPDDYTQYPSHTYANSGLYVICLTIVDANLCTSTFCDSVNVQRLSGEWVMLPSTVNVVNPAGINEVKPSQQISIYPNPANEVFYVNGKNLENMNFKVYDVLGNEVLTGTLDNNSVTVSSLTQGVYIFKITDAKGNAFTKQFIKN